MSTSLHNKKGAFEACFSQGLDLSELTTPSASIESASAQLLAIKKEESKRRHQQERQDAEMSVAVQQRALKLKQASKSLKTDRKAMTAAALHTGNLSFLVQMHQGEEPVRSKASRAIKVKKTPPMKKSNKGKVPVKKGKKRCKY